MIKTTLKIDGMMCSMCESHINKGETQIISDSPLGDDALREAVGKTGYRVLEIKTEPYEKKRFTLFGR